MKQVRVTFTDEEWEQLQYEKKKSGMPWHDLIIYVMRSPIISETYQCLYCSFHTYDEEAMKRHQSKKHPKPLQLTPEMIQDSEFNITTQGDV